MKINQFEFIPFDANTVDHKMVVLLLRSAKENMNNISGIQNKINYILDNPDRLPEDQVYVVYVHDKSVGLIFSKRDNNSVNISYEFIPQYNGESFATYVVESYCNYLFLNSEDIEDITMFVLPSDKKTKVVASRMGFIKSGQVTYKLKNNFKNV